MVDIEQLREALGEMFIATNIEIIGRKSPVIAAARELLALKENGQTIEDIPTQDLIAELVKRGEWPHGIPATPVDLHRIPWLHEEP